MRCPLPMLMLVCMFSLLPQDSFSNALLYDDVSSNIYISTAVARFKEIEKTQRTFGGKPVQEIYKLNVDKHQTELFLKADHQIGAYEMSVEGYFVLHLYWFEADKEKKCLVVYDRAGNKIKELPDVPFSDRNFTSYSWSPDGRSIVYVTGKKTLDSKWGPFEPTGVWLYNVEKGTINKITNRIAEDYIGVNWSTHDNNIYLQSRFEDTQYVGLYDIAKRQFKKSARKGLIFSDDGLYYIGSMAPKEMGDAHSYLLFKGKSDMSVYHFKIDKDGGQLEWQDHAKFISGSHYLLMWSSSKFYQIFDADKKTFLRKAKSRLLGWNKDMTKAVVYDEGKIHVDEMLTGKRLITFAVPGE